jgi:hypothetical protein
MASTAEMGIFSLTEAERRQGDFIFKPIQVRMKFRRGVPRLGAGGCVRGLTSAWNMCCAFRWGAKVHVTVRTFNWRFLVGQAPIPARGIRY